MDLDALARDLVDHYVRADFASPPFPPYVAHWAEREQARAVAAYGADAGEPDPHVPAFKSFTEERRWRLGDLDVFLYRIEPTASALLLILRNDVLAYVAFGGGRFMRPPDAHHRDEFPPYDLALMATWTRLEGELDLLPGGIFVSGDDPIRIGFQIEPSRYAMLDGAERTALHGACTPIARDTALSRRSRCRNARKRDGVVRFASTAARRPLRTGRTAPCAARADPPDTSARKSRASPPTCAPNRNAPSCR